ncbi:MAG: NADH-quinone oxidoreductase subunit L [Candidatus Omnitrophica bacterium]|nr:NADH-quinone oxidoreductase subunit L [Candidatus Omnitrophota bacterium]
MVIVALPWMILFSPLAACVLITLFFLRSRVMSAGLAIASILISFAATAAVFFQLRNNSLINAFEQSFAWIRMGPLAIDFGAILDPLSVLMLLVVTGVGSAIFIYSLGYMKDDPSFPRFFACLALFAFSMIGIVLANNFIQLFMFWELVGLSSYLLIGFWYEKPSAADAGVKAFVVNRVADFGFLCGIILLWSASDLGAGRSFLFSHLSAVVPHLDKELLHWITLLIFCGVVGKSAQVPLHVWLPDAMEGPTPVSALIHAATMVAAGIYLLCRVFFLFEAMPQALSVVAHIGAITAFLAATLAVAENDIKKILAYSTVSQLGYMVMALGLGGNIAGMYHLTTHAFFKALLFLGAGSVIYALHHKQNIWEMGGLLKSMPVTGGTFLIGTLALCGIFPLSGFWSKDEILLLAASHNTLLYWIGTFTAGLTAFYMGRVLWIAFLGEKHSSPHPVRESPAVMTFPLIFLAILSVIGGFLGIPHFLRAAEHAEFNFNVAIFSTFVAVSGLLISYLVYGKRPRHDPLEKKLGPVYLLLKNKYFFDSLYRWYVEEVQQRAAGLFYLVEKYVIVRLGIHGITWTAKGSGRILRYLQTGAVQIYALIFVLGVTYLFFRLGGMR